MYLYIFLQWILLQVGYDPEIGSYPDWLRSQPYSHMLPSSVRAPGVPIGPIKEDVRSQYGKLRDIFSFHYYGMRLNNLILLLLHLR